ncbi:MAG: hypothetical protein ABSF35_04365 [Polyangia bacterium]
MTTQSLRTKCFTTLSLLLALTGCGSSSYTIPPAELQRLTQLPPSQRGDHVRAFTPGVVPMQVAPPSPPAAVVPPSPSATPPSPPSATSAVEPPPPPPLPDTAAGGDLPPDPFGPDEVDLLAPEPPGPAIVVAVDAGPRAPVHPPAAPARPSPAPRISPPAPARTSVPPPAPGHVVAPPAPARTSVPPPAPARIAAPATTPRLPASPARGTTPVPRGSGGHPRGSSVSFPSGHGKGDAVAGAVLAVVLLVGLVAVVAEAGQPGPAFDGWIRTSPEHPVHLEYAAGRERKLRLCDLQPADLVGVRAATIYDLDGNIGRLETAADRPPLASQPRPAPAPEPARPPVPVTPPTRPAAPPVQPAAGPSAPLSWLATFDRAA